MGLIKLYQKWLFNRRVKKAVWLLKKIDKGMKQHPRWKRKQFWKDFIKSPSFREVFYKKFPEVMKNARS